MYLLDTHVWLWFHSGNLKHPKKLIDKIVDPEHSTYVSITSIWEANIKKGLGKLEFPGNLVQLTNEVGIGILSLQPEAIDLLQELPNHHKDPFDRILIAQAIAHKLTLVTKDKELLQYRDSCAIEML